MKWSTTVLLLLSFTKFGCTAVDRSNSVNVKPRRLTTQSPWFYVSEDDVALQESYSGFDPQKQKRFSSLTIGDKALDMIENADKLVIGSAFLFDTMYSEYKPGRDIVTELTNALIEKKKQNHRITIVVILDPINKSYGQRICPAVKRLVDNGVDIFYSDLISTKAAMALDIGEAVRDSLRVVDRLSLGTLGKVLGFIASPQIPIKNSLDEQGMSIESFWNSVALKANHRKLLVTDKGDTFETLISSANPHNASVCSTNFSISVKADLAKYIYMVLREDVIFSKELDYVLWGNKHRRYRAKFLTDTLSEIPPQAIHTGTRSPQTPVAVCFMTESRIRNQIINMLDEVKENDQVRIQMFYLSDLKVINAIIDTAKRVKKPVRIILDPNKDSFGKEKDGTPNRQVAAFLIEKKQQLKLNLDIRWYDTHGEQNHAKIMSITNQRARVPKYELINGSANWTGKNLKDINLEANVRVRDSRKIVTKFNRLFDLFWENSDGMVYTVDYYGKYQIHTGMDKWLNGEKWGCVKW